MAYTASALSFMCENVGKTIVLTGSQVMNLEPRPMGSPKVLSCNKVSQTCHNVHPQALPPGFHHPMVYADHGMVDSLALRGGFLSASTKELMQNGAALLFGYSFVGGRGQPLDNKQPDHFI